MTDYVTRYAQNPILKPDDVPLGQRDVVVEGVLSPGAFRYRGRIGLLLRVAERPRQDAEHVSTMMFDSATESGYKIMTFERADPEVNTTDPRAIVYRGETYWSTLSHLRLAWSDDGVHFQVASFPTLTGRNELETYGVEDCRVTEIDQRYYLTYTQVSRLGFGVGLISTDDWQHFTRHGMIFPPNNKDCAIFSEKIGGQYLALHRPTLPGLGVNHIWLSRSPDLLHWGEHVCIAQARPGKWDSARIGAGDAPIRTPEGWLEIYHGADEQNRYCLGALLLDLDDPTQVIARSDEPLMEPLWDYERHGFFGNVVFTSGTILSDDGDTLSIYYSASDTVICLGTLSCKEVLRTLTH